MYLFSRPDSSAANNLYFGHPHRTTQLYDNLRNHHQEHITQVPSRKQRRSSSSVDSDLESLDRELTALDASMPPVDPEMTQGAEQLEKAISRKRSRSDDNNDRFVREALAHFYLPSPHLVSAIDECPLMPTTEKRYKMLSSSSSSLGADMDLTHFDLNHLDHNQNQKDFDVILDALRLGNDSCGQAAMMTESSSAFHNLVIASLET